MNKIVLYVVLVFISCNEPPANRVNDKNDSVSSDTSVMTIQVPVTTCYSYATESDTVLLKVEKFPNVVTGTLEYRLKEKDKNSGEIDGVMRSDTLVADYRFTSEGKESTRQVAFLVSGDTAVEGYGDMKEEGGKMVFINPASVDFSVGMKLVKVNCNQ